MKSINELLLDVVYAKKRTLKLYIEELENSLDDGDKSIFINHEIKEKQRECDFLDDLKVYINYSEDGIKLIKELLKREENNDIFNFNDFVRINKDDILKQLIKEYKIEYKKNYLNNKTLGLKGVFDNDLFCEIIRNKIIKYTDCNRVTRKKYVHLVAFLNELLCDMENSKEPLKLLKHKMKIYSKYKNTEYIEIRKDKVDKKEILKGLLEEYNNRKMLRGVSNSVN